jgi:hypothetical protein
VEEGGQRDAHGDRREGGACLEQEPRGKNARADEVLSVPFHIIPTNTSTSITDNTSAGIVSGLSHVTFRVL